MSNLQSSPESSSWQKGTFIKPARVWLFSNPGDKVQIHVKSTGQICPVVLHVFVPCPLDLTITIHSNAGIFPTILTYMIMLENCQSNISVNGGSPIQGKKFYSCLNLLKPGLRVGHMCVYNTLMFPSIHYFILE